jgi:hypothetical protein
MKSPARRSTMSESNRRKVGHIKAMLGELAPILGNSRQRYVMTFTTTATVTLT